jgi:hypothetical protein
MSRYVVNGPLSGVDAEIITTTSSDSTLTSGKYAKSNGSANYAVITVTDANSVLITVQNTAGTLPADGSTGVFIEKASGPYTVNGDLSKVILRRGASTNCVIHVNYFNA